MRFKDLCARLFTRFEITGAASVWPAGPWKSMKFEGSAKMVSRMLYVYIYIYIIICTIVGCAVL